MSPRAPCLGVFLRIVALLAGTAGAIALPAADNDGPSRFHDVKKWRGRIVAQARPDPAVLAMMDAQMSAGSRGIRREYDFHASYTVDFELNEYESDPSVWSGRVTSGTYNASSHFFMHVPGNSTGNQPWWTGYTEVESDFTAAGMFDFSEDPGVELRFHRQRGWSVRMASGRCPVTIRKRTYRYCPPLDEQPDDHDKIICESTTEHETSEAKMLGMGSTDTFPYPKDGLILHGSRDDKARTFPMIGSAAYSSPVIWSYTVYLEPATLDELRLEIEVPPRYDTWRPMTTRDASAGPELEVTARLVTASGRTPDTHIDQFIWELVGTSREPGVAMNFPVDARDDRLDLELDASGEMYVLLHDNQRMERAVRSGFSDTVKVVPYDWGGWSTLQVTAVLSSGRRVVGRLKGAKEDGIRIPKRALDSHIADGWKAKNKSGPDDLDDDATPAGDGTKGDGLSLYEEYRGFYAAASRVEPSPDKKDLFIHLADDAKFAARGVALFRGATRIVTHAGLTQDEIPASRIINANRRQGAQVCKQHAIRIVLDPTLVGVSRAYGGPGNPRTVSRIGVMGDAGNYPASYLASTVAHELGHCVNLWHHGDADIGNTTWTVRDGKLFEGPAEITVLDERTLADLTPDIVRLAQDQGVSVLRRLWVGRQQGQHSGHENCLMRYDSAQAVVPVAPDTVRLFQIQEVVGTSLCSSPVGTGVNLAGRKPQPRYGPAATGRGNCVHQILVTDAVDAPKRLVKLAP